MKPVVTIVVPVYNGEHLLHTCLDSIQAQTFADFECILVDDGSTDGSGQLCDELAARDPRFRVLHQTNGGVCSARNAGILAAAGEYVVFCDQDDQYHPETLKTALYFQQQFSKDFIAWAFTQQLVVWEAAFSSIVPETFSSSDLARFYMGHGSFGPGGICNNLMDTFIWNKLFPVAFLKKENILFDTQYKRGTEDAAFMLLFWEKFFFKNPTAVMRWLPAPLYFWNNENSQSVTKQAYTMAGHAQKQIAFYDLMFVPFQNVFHCPPQDLVPLAHHLQRQLCVGMIRAKKAHEKVGDIWKASQFTELMNFFKVNHYYTAYYLPLLWHCQWLCRFVCRSYDHSRWWYWKLYWLGYYMFCRGWHCF